MTENVVRFNKPKSEKMPRKTAKSGAGGELVELPLPDPENLTPQQILEKLSRDKTIEKVVILIPRMGEDGETCEFYPVCMTNAELNFYAQKLIMAAQGFEI